MTTETSILSAKSSRNVEAGRAPEKTGTPKEPVDQNQQRGTIKMPVKLNEREYRAMPVLAPSENKRLDSEFYVEGAASTMGAPYELYEFDGVKYYEMIDINAFQGADMSDVIMQYDHEGRVLGTTKNNTLNYRPQGSILFVAADLSKVATPQRTCTTDIKAGLSTKMSFAFTGGRGQLYDQKTHTRIIKRDQEGFYGSFPAVSNNRPTRRPI